MDLSYSFEMTEKRCNVYLSFPRRLASLATAKPWALICISINSAGPKLWRSAGSPG
jgi:hypothetical protein